MTSAHTVRPTDLVALVAYDGRVYPNESVTRDRIGTQSSPHPLEAALEQWFSFATGRHTCISVKGATLRGLVSARKRGSKAAWEVDCLIDAGDDPGVLMGLLDKVTKDAGYAGAEKVFLRVAADSRVLKTACGCGFAPYLNERLFAAETSQAASRKDVEPMAMRRWSKADAHPAYLLYNRWTPEKVRRAEAATFREWTAARERFSPPRRTHQRVIEGDGRLAGWLRTAAIGELGRFDVMADPNLPELQDALLDAAQGRLKQQQALFILAPEFAEGLCDRLLQRGFQEQGQFTVLVKRTSRPDRLPELAPATTA